MTREDRIRDELWGTFKMLEIANVEAVKIKRQVELISGADPKEGGDIELLPCRFLIDGHRYGALVTCEQQERILITAATGNGEDVLKLVAFDFLCGHLYPAIDLVKNTLIAALRNQQFKGGVGAPALCSVGACKFADGSCNPCCSATLCKTLHGTPCDSC
jgi:hypothetical protein